MQRPKIGDALLVVDVQRDFLPGGVLAVAGGERILPVLNQCLHHFAAHHLPVFASRDWHPPHHASFRQHGGSWPPHCIRGTAGAEFPAELQLPENTAVISKAMDSDREAYSDFEGTDLAARLRQLTVSRLWVGGLATEYCVWATVRDALKLKLDVVLLSDAVAALDVHPGDGERALQQMKALGAVVVRWEDVA